MPPVYQKQAAVFSQGTPPTSRSGPTAVVGGGTAGTDVAAGGFCDALGEAGCGKQAQFLVAVNFNTSDNRRLRRRARIWWWAIVRGLKKGPHLILSPWTLPVGLVTQENLERYKDEIQAACKALVEDAGRVSRRFGYLPQLILAFIGPGNHALPAAEVLRQLGAENPTAITLPVLIMPREAQFRQQMQTKTWPEWEKSLRDMVALILGPGEERSELAARVLAAFEIAGVQRPSQRVLAEHVVAVAAEADYMGLSAAVVPLSSRWVWRWAWLPLQRVVFNSRDSFVGLIATLMENESQLAEHAPPPAGVIQRIVIAAPVKRWDLGRVAQAVEAKLVSKGFFDRYPNVWIVWAAARFPIKGSRELNAFGGRLYPLNGHVDEVTRGMAAGRPTVSGPRTRLGSGYYLAGKAQQEPPKFPRAPQEPGDDRKEPPNLPDTGAFTEAPTDPTRPGGAGSINISVTQKVTEHKFS